MINRVSLIMCRSFKIFRGIAFFAFLFQIKLAFAAAVYVSGVPTAWQIESYGEKGVTLWFTPSKCANGHIALPSTATTVDHNRLYATIMAAKMAQAKVFIFYDDSTTNCTIVSYGLAPSN